MEVRQKDVETNLHFPAKIGEKENGRRGDTNDCGKTCVACSYIILYGRLYPSLVQFQPRPTRNIWPGGLIYTPA